MVYNQLNQNEDARCLFPPTRLGARALEPVNERRAARLAKFERDP